MDQRVGARAIMKRVIVAGITAAAAATEMFVSRMFSQGESGMRTLFGFTLVLAVCLAGTARAQSICPATGNYLTGSQMATDFNTFALQGGTAPHGYNEIHNITSAGGTISEIGKGSFGSPASPSYGTVTITVGNGLGFSSGDTISYAYNSGFHSGALVVTDTSGTGGGPYDFCSAPSTLYTASTRHK